jgi:repressor LexA
MYGLNGAACARRDSGWAAQLLENVFDDGLHKPSDIRCSDITQVGHYPKCAIPCEIPTWQNIRMNGKGFDPDLVRQKMRDRGVTQADLSRVAQLPSQSAMSNILKGIRRVTADEAKRIYTFLGIEEQPAFRVVPVIGITSAGLWREAVELPIGYMPIPPNIAGLNAFGLEVSGDSMNKLIEDGGWVLIDPDRKELQPGSCYLIKNTEGEATVKMYERTPARFEPCSTNPEHTGFLMAEAEFTIIGKVVWKGARVP